MCQTMMSFQFATCGLTLSKILRSWGISQILCPKAGSHQESTSLTWWTQGWVSTCKVSSDTLTNRGIPLTVRLSRKKQFLSLKRWWPNWTACLISHVSSQSSNLFYRETRQNCLSLKGESKACLTKQEEAKDRSLLASRTASSSAESFLTELPRDGSWQRSWRWL